MTDRRVPLGVTLLVIGVLGGFYCHRRLAGYESGVGFLKKSFSEEHASKASALETGRIAGGIVALAGLSLLVRAGLKSR